LQNSQYRNKLKGKKGEIKMSLINKAIEFAAYAHREQKRKGTEIPYISHPYAVGMKLLRTGCTEEAIIAGILHDTLEDTETTEKQIVSLFGPVVLEIVKGCSESDKGASWEDRKQHTLDELKYASLAIRQVSCADKLHNIHSILRDLEVNGEETWTRFKRGREDQKWYYEGLVKSLGYSSHFPMLDEFAEVVAEVFSKRVININEN
jgi:(p)ppGpp synthase/HD superfamily hydrolase